MFDMAFYNRGVDQELTWDEQDEYIDFLRNMALQGNLILHMCHLLSSCFRDMYQIISW
jgi:hypothetical protein